MTNAVKVLGMTDSHYRVGGYGVVFGGRDLDGETFTADTNYQLDLVPNKPILYDHMQGDLKTALGIWDPAATKIDDVGVWFEGELTRAKQYAKWVEPTMALIHAKKLGLSTGTASHLAQRDAGVIKSWPIIEVSLTPTPAEPRTLGVRELKSLLDALPDLGDVLPAEGAEESPADMQPETAAINQESSHGGDEVSEQEVTNAPAQPVADGNAAILEAIKALGADVAKVNERVKAFEADTKAANDPGIAVPAVIVDTDHWKYDNVDNESLGVLVGVLDAAKRRGQSNYGARPAAYKALGMRLESDEALSKSEAARVANRAMKSSGIKANEIAQSTLANYGDEWAGVYYSGALWEKVRQETFVLNMLPSFEVPQGAESVVIPLEGTDPTWYKVAQAASLTANPGAYSGPINTVTASTLGTANTTLTLSKMGARVLWTGEMEEDAMLPYVAQLRNQLVTSGAEYLESAIIDGDTEAGATTNINDIAGTPAATDWFMVWNGFRKVPLVTLTANSRDGGALDESDFLETVKLMGTGGIAGYDQQRVGFIVDRHTHYKALELAVAKTRDVFGNPTIEGGRLSSIWGYNVYMSGQIARATNGLTNTAGKSDQNTAGNNTKGQILAVRWDRWRFGWRRRMTIEATRVPAADSTEIVALMRAGLIYSATDDAAAISYNLTV